MSMEKGCEVGAVTASPPMLFNSVSQIRGPQQGSIYAQLPGLTGN